MPHAHPNAAPAQLWTAEELAEHLQKSERSVRELVYRGAVPFQRVGRSLRFKPEEIEEWERLGCPRADIFREMNGSKARKNR